MQNVAELCTLRPPNNAEASSITGPRRGRQSEHEGIRRVSEMHEPWKKGSMVEASVKRRAKRAKC